MRALLSAPRTCAVAVASSGSRAARRPGPAPSKASFPRSLSPEVLHGATSARRTASSARGACSPTPSHVARAAAEVEASCFEELSAGMDRKYVMISGKGGVGKTSLSASLAVQLAAAGHTVLVVSTDPAHSLSDSLDQDVSGGEPVAVEGTSLPIWGMEIDPDEAKKEFISKVAKDDGKEAKDFMSGMGLGMITEQLADLKLGELLDTPPPGLDEAICISKVVSFVNSEKYAKFTRIVFDTAPTGHTLRLLSLPDFVDASLGKVIKLRKRLSGASSAVTALFGTEGSKQDDAIEKLETMRERMVMVRDLFRKEGEMEFVIATIPTVLGVSESSRLAGSLKKEGVPVKRIIVNQIISEGMGDAYLKMKLRDQERSLTMIREDPQLSTLRQIEAPLVDLEARGVPALQYFGGAVWGPHLDELAASSRPGRQFYMLGGKGGVGKTTMSSCLAVQLAASGHNTLIVSTDPAHSLGDALAQDIGGGKPVPVEGTDLPLWGMEIDLDEARDEIRSLGKSEAMESLTSTLQSMGMGGMAEQLADLNLGELLNTAPPGVDEAVAISKVVQFLRSPEYEKFDRIVFDTAPTGHTLRLLTLPDFLDVTLGKVVRLKGMISGATDALKSLFNQGASEDIDVAEDKLKQLKSRMEEARELFRNPDTTQFLIVTIPTVMAASESSRLAAALRKEHVPVNTVVVNQVVQQAATESFLQLKRKDQLRAIQMLHDDPELSQLQMMEAPLFDLEVRGVAALQYFGSQVWK